MPSVTTTAPFDVSWLAPFCIGTPSTVTLLTLAAVPRLDGAVYHTVPPRPLREADPAPCLLEHLAENAGQLVELGLARDERRRDLDNRVAAVVGAADEAPLEERRRDETA